LVTQVMAIAWSPALLPLLGVLVAAILAVLLVGGAGLLRLVELPAAPVLRGT